MAGDAAHARQRAARDAARGTALALGSPSRHVARPPRRGAVKHRARSSRAPRAAMASDDVRRCRRHGDDHRWRASAVRVIAMMATARARARFGSRIRAPPRAAPRAHAIARAGRRRGVRSPRAARTRERARARARARDARMRAGARNTT
ncbi:MAG: hypothetical protein WDW36_008280 [Sanguina aurantia]